LSHTPSGDQEANMLEEIPLSFVLAV